MSLWVIEDKKEKTYSTASKIFLNSSGRSLNLVDPVISDAWTLWSTKQRHQIESFSEHQDICSRRIASGLSSWRG